MDAKWECGKDAFVRYLLKAAIDGWNGTKIDIAIYKYNK